jgi:hypothetical protein
VCSAEGRCLGFFCFARAGSTQTPARVRSPAADKGMATTPRETTRRALNYERVMVMGCAL